jgi:hypothetical protein
MNRADPTTAESNFLGTADREISVEEVAEIQTLDATMAEAGCPGTPAVELRPEQPATEVSPQLPQPSTPKTPNIPHLPRRPLSGRYRSGGMGFQLELRIDVDGRRPMMKVSGDFFQVSGATMAYFGSFIVDAPVLTVLPNLVIVNGFGRYTWNAAAPKIRISIPRTFVFAPPAPATVQFFTLTNHAGALHVCQHVSAYFRTVQYELNRVADVTTPVFDQYNTGALPSGGPLTSMLSTPPMSRSSSAKAEWSSTR